MYELSQTIPDAKVLLAMEPEELGAKILFVLRKRSNNMTRSQSFLWPNSGRRPVCRANSRLILGICRTRSTSPWGRLGHG